MTSQKPKVTIGMPVYNGADYLPATLESLLNQTFTDFELVISDNASTDDSERICRQYAAKDPRIRYHRNTKNIGASDNYNTVYFLAKGEYFKWASSNDICAPDFIEHCVKVLDERPDVVLSYPMTRLITNTIEDAEDYDENLDVTAVSACERFKSFMKNIKLNNVMNGVIRTSALKHSAMIKTFFNSDTSLMAEMALYGKFVQVPHTYFYRRMDPETATKFKSSEEVLKHYDPELKNLMLFQNWKLHIEMWKAVWRAPITRIEKVCLYRYLVRRLLWSRQDLLSDITLSFRKLAHIG